jgi:hypothetical protein
VRFVIPFAAAWARGISLALTLAVIGETSFAQGIIHIVPAQPLYYSYLLTSRDIDLDNDGVADFNLNSPDSLAINLTPLNNNGILSVLEPPPDIGAFIYALPAGASISPSLNPAFVWFDRNSSGGSATIVASSTIGSLGYFQGSTDAYAGIRFESGGNFHYGWLHIQNFGLNLGQISEWAYESNPNTSILAGAVPEPSALALLTVAGIALLARRKRAAIYSALKVR